MSGQDYQQRQTGRHAPDRSGAIVPGIDRTERDFVALGIILAAIILFVGT